MILVMLEGVWVIFEGKNRIPGSIFSEMEDWIPDSGRNIIWNK